MKPQVCLTRPRPAMSRKAPKTPDAAKSENEEVDEMKRRLAELEELVSKLGPKKAARKKKPATRRRPHQAS